MRWLRARSARHAAAIFAVALIVRLVYVAWLGFTLPPAELTGDDVDYYNIAVNIADGHGVSRTWQGAGPDNGKLVPTAYRTPLWPLVEAAVFKVTGPSPTIGRVLTVVLDAIACVLLFWLARRLRGPTVGLVAGLVAAVYPPLWIYVGALFSEPMMTLTVLLALLAADRYRLDRSPRSAVLLGGALGLVTLARPNGLVIAGLLVVWILWLGRDDLARAARRAAVSLVATTIVVAPWLAYASVRMGEFVPVTTQGGVLLAGDFNDTVVDTGDPRWGYWDYDLIIGRLFTSRDENEWNDALLDEGKQWIGDHPGGTAKALVLRTIRYYDLYWSLDDRADVGIPTFRDGINVAVVLSWWVAFGLAIAGVRRAVRQRQLERWIPSLVVFVAVAISGMLLGGATRYRAPAEPIVVLLAASYAVARVSERRSAGRRHDCVPTPAAP